MTKELCDECGDTFDTRDWHPATLDDDGSLHEFCSQECKEQFAADPAQSATVTD